MAPLEAVDVRQLPTAAAPGARNMALDAAAADHVAEGGPASVRVYEWEPSTLSLGYAQDPGTIDWAFCDEERIDVTRRPTGGGAIYHDRMGDISYSIVAPRDVLPENLMESYTLLCQPVLDAFSRLGLDVQFAESHRPAVHEPVCYLRALHPSHDLAIPREAGDRKISGNAQYRRRDAVIQHGSITFSLKPERHLGCFTADLEEATFRDRVTGIENHVDVTREQAITALEDALREWALAERGDWTEQEHYRADELVETTFGAEPWIKEQEGPFTRE